MDAKVPSLRRFVFGYENPKIARRGRHFSQKIGEEAGDGETWIPFGSSQGGSHIERDDKLLLAMRSQSAATGWFAGSSNWGRRGARLEGRPASRIL